jgi:preprotein translocase subunit YajC
MIGCLKLVGFFILGFIYLIFLAAAPQTAIIWGVAALIGYFFWSRQQREERKKAEEQCRKAEEQRRKAIALARQRDDLYEYDPSIQLSDKRSTKNIFENPEDWADSIQCRYNIAQKCVQDAELVLNDDVQQFNQYRSHLQTELVSKYENAIRPYFGELSSRDGDIPTPRELKVAIDFVYPSNLQPSAIHGGLTRISEGFARGVSNSLSNSLRNKNIMKLQQGDVVTIAASIAITAAISGIFYLLTASQQRTKLEKLQADVDLICEQISGAIKTYGKASQEIKHAKLVHEVAVNYMMRYLDTVIQLSSQEKQFSELEREEQKAVETCYRGGESLKKILQQDLIQPIG